MQDCSITFPVYKKNNIYNGQNLYTSNTVGSAKTKQDNDTFEKNSSYKSENHKKLTKNQKFLIGAGVIATALGVSILLFKGKLCTTKKLAESIEFTPAKTIEEAKEFARVHLGIKKYKIDNLDVANWTNAGLTQVANATHGKCVMPKEIRFNNGIKTSAASTNRRILTINKDYIENIDNNIQKLIENYSKSGIFHIDKKNTGIQIRTNLPHLFDNSLIDDIKKHTQNPSEMNIGDKIHLMKKLSIFKDYLHYINDNPLKELKELTSRPELQERLKQLKIPTDSTVLKKLSKSEQINILFDIFSSCKLKPQATFKDKFWTIKHEMGHIQHFAGNDNRYLNQLLKISEYEKQGKAPSKEAIDYISSETKQKTASQVSFYAKASPLEFVAEVYAGLINGHKYSNEVMELYKAYKGALI